jgi:ribosomal-protein-alanine N-acetyltransferase
VDKSLEIFLRKAKFDDIDRIIEIETEQFLHPWKRSAFVNELTHDIAWFYVAECTLPGKGKTVAGYIIFWVFGDTMELHDIAVAGDQKRKGIGKRLYELMMETARKKNVEEIFLEVRQSNDEAIAFYYNMGFQQVGMRKNYYSQPTENALIFRLLPKNTNGEL